MTSCISSLRIKSETRVRKERNQGLTCCSLRSLCRRECFCFQWTDLHVCLEPVLWWITSCTFVLLFEKLSTFFAAVFTARLQREVCRKLGQSQIWGFPHRKPLLRTKPWSFLVVSSELLSLRLINRGFSFGELSVQWFYLERALLGYSVISETFLKMNLAIPRAHQLEWFVKSKSCNVMHICIFIIRSFFFKLKPVSLNFFAHFLHPWSLDFWFLFHLFFLQSILCDV